MKGYFEIRVRQHFEYSEHVEGDQAVQLESTAYRIETSPEISREPFVETDGYPTTAGHVVVQDTLIRGLISNLHLEHSRHGIDLAARFREIISEMEEQFVGHGTHLLSQLPENNRVVRKTREN